MWEKKLVEFTVAFSRINNKMSTPNWHFDAFFCLSVFQLLSSDTHPKSVSFYLLLLFSSLYFFFFSPQFFASFLTSYFPSLLSSQFRMLNYVAFLDRKLNWFHLRMARNQLDTLYLFQVDKPKQEKKKRLFTRTRWMNSTTRCSNLFVFLESIDQ